MVEVGVINTLCPSHTTVAEGTNVKLGGFREHGMVMDISSNDKYCALPELIPFTAKRYTPELLTLNVLDNAEYKNPVAILVAEAIGVKFILDCEVPYKRAKLLQPKVPSVVNQVEAEYVTPECS